MVELDRALSRMLKAAGPEAAERALRAGGDVFADAARRNVHRQSGDLGDSIEVSTQANDDRSSEREPKVFVGPTGDKGFYGHMEEFGTDDTPAHPFMRTAFDSEVGAAQEAVADVARAEVAKQAKG